MESKKAPDLSTSGERLEIQVYKQLLDKIRFGEYALGERLPSEADLCEEYGVSRPIIRASLSKLRDSGLIVSRQGAGSFVNSGVVTDRAGFSPLNSITDIAAYFRFRQIIEAKTAECAATNAGSDGAARLLAIVDEMEAALGRGEDAVAFDIKFHTTIADLSGNRFLAETVAMLHPHWVFVGNFLKSLGVTGERTGNRMVSEHMNIANAIAAGDPAAARKAMLSHIDGSEKRVFKGA